MDISAASVDPISKTAPDEDIRPLVPLAGSEIAGGGTIAAETMAAWRRTPAYAELLTYFESYPPRSLMGPHSRAILFSLIRMLRPKVVAEVGTLFAGTTETLAHAPWENGEGVIHTTDPFGADRCPPIIGSWPRELQEITEFHPLNSMDFFGTLAQRRIALDMVLVDGSHDYEYAYPARSPRIGDDLHASLHVAASYRHDFEMRRSRPVLRDQPVVAGGPGFAAAPLVACADASSCLIDSAGKPGLTSSNRLGRIGRRR